MVHPRPSLRFLHRRRCCRYRLSRLFPQKHQHRRLHRASGLQSIGIISCPEFRLRPKSSGEKEWGVYPIEGAPLSGHFRDMGDTELMRALKKQIQDLDKLKKRSAEAAAKTAATLMEVETKLKECKESKKQGH